MPGRSHPCEQHSNFSALLLLCSSVAGPFHQETSEPPRAPYVVVAAPCARRESGWEELNPETPADQSWAEAGGADLHSAFAFPIQTKPQESSEQRVRKTRCEKTSHGRRERSGDRGYPVESCFRAAVPQAGAHHGHRPLGSILDQHFPVNSGIKTLLNPKNLTFSCPLSPKSSRIGQIQPGQGDAPRFPGIFQVPVCCGGN